ncbi:hypothetical protein PENTCL1PPCAC_28611, partial [Pristionchus entomophagus]
GLAQIKRVDFLKLCVLGLSRVLMTMGKSILPAEPTLAPDGVTSSTLKCDFDVTPSGANRGSMGKMDTPIVISTLDNPKTHSFRPRNGIN